MQGLQRVNHTQVTSTTNLYQCMLALIASADRGVMLTPEDTLARKLSVTTGLVKGIFRCINGGTIHNTEEALSHGVTLG